MMIWYHLQLPLWSLWNIAIAMLVGLQNTNDDISPSIMKNCLITWKKWLAARPGPAILRATKPSLIGTRPLLRMTRKYIIVSQRPRPNLLARATIMITFTLWLHISINAFFGMLNVPSKPISNSQKIIIYQFCMTIMLLEKFITKHLTV